MSYSTVERDIELYLKNNWAVTSIDINQNVDFTSPDPTTSFIKLRIVDDSASRVNIGQPAQHRVKGIINIEIYTPIHGGTRTAKVYADSLSDMFSDLQFNGITCEEAQVVTIGDFHGRWRTDVNIPYWWDGLY